MNIENINSVFKELVTSIQFAIDSKKGKYSLETYLEIIGEYTDQAIISSRKEGLHYTGGECTVQTSKREEGFVFELKMYFVDADNQAITKEAVRNIPKYKFTRQAIEAIADEKITFIIEEPKEDE